MFSQFKDKNILILGGMGFIGSNLAIRLVELGSNVTIVDSLLPQYGGNLKNIENIRDKVTINYSDIRDRYSLNILVSGRDIIYSVAGQTSHIESMEDPFTDLEINCVSQLAILESCRQYNPSVNLVYASTRQLYGVPQYLPVDERHPTTPTDINGINKLAAEMYYNLYSKIYGIKAISLRLTNTYGPRQHLKSDKQGFAGIFIRKAIDGETIQIFGDGTQLRDFNYIDDVIDAFLLASQLNTNDSGVYNLGSPDYCSLLDFVKILGKYCHFEIQLVPFPVEHRRIDIGNYYGDYTRFETKTGWKPQISLEEGLKRTVNYFRQYRHDYW